MMIGLVRQYVTGIEAFEQITDAVNGDQITAWTLFREAAADSQITVEKRTPTEEFKVIPAGIWVLADRGNDFSFMTDLAYFRIRHWEIENLIATIVKPPSDRFAIVTLNTLGPKPGVTSQKSQMAAVALMILNDSNKRPQRGHGRLTAIARMMTGFGSYKENTITKHIRATVRDWEKDHPKL
jgi:hypothetical protein